MPSSDQRSAQQDTARSRDGSAAAPWASLLWLGGAYLAALFALEFIGRLLPSAASFAGVVQILFVCLLGIIIARVRDDGPLPTGAFVAVLTAVHLLLVNLYAQVVEGDSVWAAVAGIPGILVQLAVRAVTLGAVCAGLLWVLRRVWPPAMRPPASSAGSA